MLSLMHHSKMNISRELIFAAFSVALAAPMVVSATERPSRLSQPLTPTQNVIIENTAITAGEFWESYTSENADHRRRAELFLLGVLDATEGVSWCDYRTYKTITIDERLYSELKKLGIGQKDERAAKVIVRVLSKSFPCGRKKQ